MAKFISDENIRLNLIINGGSENQKKLLDLEKSTRSLTRANKDLKAERLKLVTAGKKNSQEYKDLTKEITKNNAVIKQNKAQMEALQKEIGITGLTIDQLKKRAALLRMKLIHAIPGGEAAQRYEKELKAISARLLQLQGRAKKTKISLSSLANGFNKYAAMGASVIATLTGAVISLQKMIDYNGKLSDAQADVMKTTGLTKKEVDELTKSFGALQTRTSRINLLKIAEEGGRIGIAKEELASFVDVMNQANVALGDSFQGGPSEIAAKLGKIKLLFKETKDIKVEKAYHAIGSAINDLGANGVATEANIVEFTTRLGSLSDGLKPPISDALALGAAFEESGIQAEIGARAYSIFLKQAANESEKFAKVMGISTQEVEDMINSNPTEFFLTFSEGLKGMNATDTAATLKELSLNADGTNKIVGAAANNVDLFRKRLDLSNQSMIKADSLTKEYNVKNNNLAALLDKVKKRLQAAFSSKTVTDGVTSVVGWFGKLIGAVKDLNEEFGKQSKVSYENAVNHRKLANESQDLLNKYISLTKDGVKPTKEEKEKLDTITLQLKDRLGESVIAIDKETGSYKLNTEAVREQIRLKRLTADEEAMTLVSRKKGVEERKKDLETEMKLAQKEHDLRKKYYEERNASALEAQKNTAFMSLEEQQAFAKGLEGYDEYQASKRKVLKLDREFEEQKKREIDLTKKLNELNFSQEDVDNFFKSTGPKEGDTKSLGNTNFVFKNGKWEVIKVNNKKTGNLGGESEEEKVEEQLTQFLLDQQFKREQLKKTALQQELDRVKKGYEDKIKLAGDNHELVKQLEADRDLELEDLKLQRTSEAQQRIKDLEEQLEQEKAATDEEKEVLKAEQDLEKHLAELDRIALNEEEKSRLILLLKEQEKIALAKIDDKYRKKELRDRQNLHKSILNQSLNLVGQETRIGQALVAIKGVFAAKETLIQLGLLKNQVAIGTAKATAATAEGTAQTAKVGFPQNIPLLIGFAAQVAGIISAIKNAANPDVSMSGFEDGLYNVIREQDGKHFQASYGGATESGLVTSPTVFTSPKMGSYLVGEKEPELIIDGGAYKQMDPGVKYSLHREIARLKGFETGLYNQNSSTAAPAETDPVTEQDLPNSEAIEVIARNTAILEKIYANGVFAVFKDDLRAAKTLQEQLDKYQALYNKNKIN